MLTVETGWLAETDETVETDTTFPLIGVPGGRQFLELQPADEAPRMSRDPASQTLAVDLSALVCNIGEHFIQFNVVGVGADAAGFSDDFAHHRRSVADHLA